MAFGFQTQFRGTRRFPKWLIGQRYTDTTRAGGGPLAAAPPQISTPMR
jgi:hypothetical protein